jgi:riboflavin synthase
MFTGLIEATGRIAAITASDRGRQVRVATPLAGELTPGESVAVNGVCLTVTTADAAGFAADVSPETLRVTTWLTAEAGRIVNLERPLRADARLGGHFVLGHVDGVGRVVRLDPDGDCHRLDVDLPETLRAYVIPKGSIAVDGVSLTVNAIDGLRMSMQLVPFTVGHTAFAQARPGDAVNVETDVLGKYVVGLMEDRARLVTPAAPAQRTSTS